MKLSLYSRLARSGMRNNRQLYLPYLLTCICMVMMYYIISAISVSDMVAQMRGGDAMGMILTLGRFVIAIFAAIFLLYTNSFLIRRRNINGEHGNPILRNMLPGIGGPAEEYIPVLFGRFGSGGRAVIGDLLH